MNNHGFLNGRPKSLTEYEYSGSIMAGKPQQGSVLYVEPGGRWIQKLGRGGTVAIRQPVDGQVHIGDVVEIDKSGKTKTIPHGVGKGRGD